MRIPIYDEQQVAPTQDPGVEVQSHSTAAGTAALASGLAAASAGADAAMSGIAKGQEKHQQIAAAEQQEIVKLNQRADDQLALEQFTKWTSDADGVLTGRTAEGQGGTDNSIPAPPGFAPMGPADGTLQGGLLNAKGKAAVGASIPTLDYIQQRRDAYLQSLPSDTAREKFKELTDRQLEGYHRQVEEHVSQQAEAAHALTEQRVTSDSFSTIGSAVTNAKSLEEALPAIQDAIAPVHAAIDSLNHDPDVAAQKKAAYDQEVYSGVVHQLLDGKKDWRSAEAILDAHEKEIGYGEHGAMEVAELRKAVGLLKGEQDAESAASDLAKSSAIGNSGLVDVAAFDKGIREGEAFKTKAGEAAGVKYRGIIEDQNKAVTNNHYGAAFSAFLQGGHSLTAVPATEKAWLQTNAPDDWSRLEEAQARWQSQNRPRGARDNAVTPAQIELAKVLGDMGAHPEKFDPAQGGMDPTEFARQYAGLLDKETYRQASAKHAEIIAAGQKGTSAGLPTDGLQAVLQAGHGKLWDKEQPTKMSDDSAKAYGRVVQVAEDFRKTFKAGHGGKEPARADYDKAIAPEMLNVTVPGTFGMLLGGDQVPLAKYETSPDYADKGAMPEAKVPDDWANVIRQEVTAARGRTPTDDEVRTIYLAKLRKLSRQKAAAQPAPAPAPAAPDFVPQAPHAKLRAPGAPTNQEG